MTFTSKWHGEEGAEVKRSEKGFEIHVAETHYAGGDLVGYKWPKEADLADFDQMQHVEKKKAMYGSFIVGSGHTPDSVPFYGAYHYPIKGKGQEYYSTTKSQPKFVYLTSNQIESKGCHHGSWHLIGSFYYEWCANHGCLHPIGYDCSGVSSAYGGLLGSMPDPWELLGPGGKKLSSHMPGHKSTSMSEYTFHSVQGKHHVKPGQEFTPMPLEKLHDHILLRPRPRIKDIGKYKQEGVTYVYTLLRAEESPYGINTACNQYGIKWRIHTLDSRSKSMSPLASFFDAGMHLAKIVRDYTLTKGKVLVHCAAGIHRTGMVAYIALRRLGVTHHDAIEFLKKQRPLIVEKSYGRLEHVAEGCLKYPLKSIYYDIGEVTNAESS